MSSMVELKNCSWNLCGKGKIKDLDQTKRLRIPSESTKIIYPKALRAFLLLSPLQQNNKKAKRR